MEKTWFYLYESPSKGCRWGVGMFGKSWGWKSDMGQSYAQSSRSKGSLAVMKNRKFNEKIGGKPPNHLWFKLLKGHPEWDKMYEWPTPITFSFLTFSPNIPTFYLKRLDGSHTSFVSGISPWGKIISLNSAGAIFGFLRRYIGARVNETRETSIECDWVFVHFALVSSLECETINHDYYNYNFSV